MSSFLVKIYFLVRLLQCYNQCEAPPWCHLVAKQFRGAPSLRAHWAYLQSAASPTLCCKGRDKLEFEIESRTKASSLIPPGWVIALNRNVAKLAWMLLMVFNNLEGLRHWTIKLRRKKDCRSAFQSKPWAPAKGKDKTQAFISSEREPVWAELPGNTQTWWQEVLFSLGNCYLSQLQHYICVVLWALWGGDCL